MIHQKTFLPSQPLIYLIGTPIGNRQDFSPRAHQVLSEVDLILAEDTRVSRKLLGLDWPKPLISFHKFNEHQRFSQIKKWIEEGKNLAIISDAGVPLIADPGFRPLTKLRKELIVPWGITALNAGPAFVHAILISGIGGENHYFHGFLQARGAKQKSQELSQLIRVFHSTTAIIFYESVHRLIATLQVLLQLLSSTTEIAIVKELTKINEELARGSLEEVFHFVQGPKFHLRGEFVVLIAPQSSVPVAWTETQILDRINHFLAEGYSLKQAAQIVSDLSGWSKNEIYQLSIAKKS